MSSLIEVYIFSLPVFKWQRSVKPTRLASLNQLLRDSKAQVSKRDQMIKLITPTVRYLIRKEGRSLREVSTLLALKSNLGPSQEEWFKLLHQPYIKGKFL